ncbi:MAG: hypothetical protein KatS3mg105_3000 [Gemmatales bacterium]|nr:MAG: hypothetical protein KatS3mg105_3000 [Gemmatales bacterium]
MTVKAANLLRRADVVLYAGSLIPETILRRTNPRAELHNSAYLTLEETDSIVQQGVAQGKLVVRLHSGDTSIYSAIAEQIERLDKAKIRYEVIPGISAFQAAAAFLKTEWTLPGRVQTVILTRAEGRTKMPSREALEKLAVHQATLCLFLSAKLGDTVQEKLLSAYPPETPVALFYRVTWPDQQVVLTELRSLSKTLKECGFTRTTLIVVGEAVAGIGGRSKLYDPRHGHLFRPRTGERGNRPGD